MAVSKSDISFLLTSVEHDLAQTVAAQSLGGFPSTSSVYSETTLTSSVGLYDTSIPLADPSNLLGDEFLNINFEIIKTNSITGNTATANERGFGGLANAHATSDVVRGLSVSSLFNDKMDGSFSQYRCVAVRNDHATDIAQSVQVYVKQNSRSNRSKIRIAIENPKNDYLGSAATGGTKIKLVDTSLVSDFEDNHFQGAILRITSGQNSGQSRVISSYDLSDKAFVLDSSLPFTVASGDTYTVDAGPSQRVPSGVVAPVVGTTQVSEFSLATGNDPVDLDFNTTRDNGDDLEPNDVFYIWVKRTLDKDAPQFDANNAIITVNFLAE